MDDFVDLIQDVLLLNDVPKDCIFTRSYVELPGYYRPSKKWDLLVIDKCKNELIIAIEFKSQVGPSFGNNFNNRTEEAMGSALDIWTAYREGVFGVQKAPWLGYFLILEDCSKSNEPVRVNSLHFPVLKEFIDASYKERYEIFCSKLLLLILPTSKSTKQWHVKRDFVQKLSSRHNLYVIRTRQCTRHVPWKISHHVFLQFRD